MNNIIYRPPRAQHFDINGNPLDSGRLIFFSAGTETLKEVYSGIDQTTPAPNPHVLDAGGFVQDGGLWLGEGNYKVQVQKSDGAGGWVDLYAPIDNVAGSDFYANQDQTTVTTIQDMRDSTATGIVTVLGYYSQGDLGGGTFYWDSTSTATDDGGIVLARTGGGVGRYIRQFNSATVIPQWWGAVPNDNSLNVAGNFSNANLYAEQNDLLLQVSGGEYWINGSFFLAGDTEFLKDTEFRGTGTVTISGSFKCEQLTKIVTFGEVNLVNESLTPSVPEWWDCSGDGVTDDIQAFNICISNTTNSIRIVGDYLLDSTGGSVSNKLIFDGGSIVFGNTTSFAITGEYENPKLRGDFVGLAFIAGDVFRSSWFFDAGIISVSNYDEVLGAIANPTGKWIWDTNTEFQSDYTLANANEIEHKFDRPIILNANVKFGRIDEHSTYCFQPQGNGTAFVVDGDLQARWFGVWESSINITETAQAIENAINSLQSGQWLDFGDNSITLDSTVLPSQTGEIRLKNGVLVGEVQLQGTLYARDFSVQNIGGDGLTTIATNPIEISGGTWDGNTVLTGDYINCSGATFKDSVDFTFGDGTSESLITGNDFEEVTITTSDTLAYGQITNNHFDNLIVNQPTYLKISDNYFSRESASALPFITLNATTSNKVVESLIIEKNFFAYLTTPSAMIAVTGTFASTGHLAFIGNNDSSLSLFLIEGTQVEFNATTASPFAFPANKLLFPFSLSSGQGLEGNFCDYGRAIITIGGASGGYVTSGTVSYSLGGAFTPYIVLNVSRTNRRVSL